MLLFRSPHGANSSTLKHCQPARPAAQAHAPPDTQALLAQLVAAQIDTQARLGRIEGLMEAMLDELRQEGQEGCCGHGEDEAGSQGEARGEARRLA